MMGLIVGHQLKPTPDTGNGLKPVRLDGYYHNQALAGLLYQTPISIGG